MDKVKMFTVTFAKGRAWGMVAKKEHYDIRHEKDETFDVVPAEDYDKLKQKYNDLLSRQEHSEI